MCFFGGGLVAAARSGGLCTLHYLSHKSQGGPLVPPSSGRGPGSFGPLLALGVKISAPAAGRDAGGQLHHGKKKAAAVSWLPLLGA